MAGIASLLSQFEGFGGDDTAPAPAITRRTVVEKAPTPSTSSQTPAKNVEEEDGDLYEMPTTTVVTTYRGGRPESFSGFGNVAEEKPPEPPRRPSLATPAGAPEPPKRPSLIKGRAAAAAITAAGAAAPSALASSSIYEEPVATPAAPAVPTNPRPRNSSSSSSSSSSPASSAASSKRSNANSAGGQRRTTMGNMFSKAKKGIKTMKKKMGRMAGGKRMRAASGTTHDDPSYPRVVSDLGEMCAPVGYNLLEALAKMKETSLLKAVEKAAAHCGGSFKDNVAKAEAFAATCIKSKSNGKLTKKEVAAIHVYTQKSPLHAGFNGALGGLGADGRFVIEAYLPFCKILMNALRKLKPIPTCAAYRGVKLSVTQLLGSIGQGGVVEWWGCPSASLGPDLLRGDDFNNVKSRVVFQIKAENAVNVHAFSDRAGANEDFAVEDEIMLLPGSRFIVDAITGFENGITEVQMHEVGKGAGIYTDVESKYDTIDPEAEDIYAPAGLYLEPGTGPKASANNNSSSVGGMDDYDSDDYDMDNEYDAIDEEEAPSVPARGGWKALTPSSSQNNISGIYTEPTATTTQDAGIYLGIGDDDIDVDEDVDLDELTGTGGGGGGGGNNVYMSISERADSFGFGGKPIVKKATVPAWKQKQRAANTASATAAVPTWKLNQQKMEQERRERAAAASSAGNVQNDVYMDVNNATTTTAGTANDIYMDVAKGSATTDIYMDVAKGNADEDGDGSISIVKKRASVFGFDSVPFGKSNNATTPAKSNNSAVSESSTDGVYMEVTRAKDATPSSNLPVAKGVSDAIRERATSFLGFGGDGDSSTDAKPAAVAPNRGRLANEIFSGFSGELLQSAIPSQAAASQLDWKANLLRKKAEKELANLEKQEQEANKYAHLPQWKQDLIMKKQAKLSGAGSNDVEA